MKKLQLGDIVSGRVMAVLPTVDDKPGFLTISLSGNTEGIVPMDEVSEIVEADSNASFISRRYMGRNIIAKVVGFNPLTLSIKEAVNERLPEVNVKVGQELTGIVVFCNRGMAEIEYDYCLRMELPASEYGLIRVGDLSKVLGLGQEIQVEVKSIEDDKIIVSHKKFAPDPWPAIQAKYRVRGQYLGRVVKIINSGVFVNLQPGLDVLAAPKPSFFDVFPGDEVALEITDIEPNAGKIKGRITALVSSERRKKIV